MTPKEAAVDLARRLSALVSAIADAIEAEEIQTHVLTRAIEDAKRLDAECRDLILRASCGRGECMTCHADLGPRIWIRKGLVTHGFCPACGAEARRQVDAHIAARRVSSGPCANGRSAKP